ncbi:MAG: DNA repair protein RecN [Deltaproteobacteria bacterium]|nr:DNA repair protein RecN [Deltaproteobacteria bacterium]
MISLLRISGFALIDELELTLGPGLTVLTGETGAGKSIIVEALGLLRGGRATAEVIRTGRDEARVEAAIELPAAGAVRDRLAQDGRDIHGDLGELLVRRTVARSGRGRVHLGGALATAGDLAGTVGGLIDIASQHDQQTLTEPDNQLAILDDFADAGALRVEMTAAHSAVIAAREDLERFDTDARTRAEREDLLRYQLSEVESAGLSDPDEENQLKAERERLRGAEKFQAAVGRGEDVLYAGENAVVGQLASVTRELSGLSGLDPTLAPFVERLREAQAQIEDVARELVHYGQGISSDPARLGEVEDRLFLLARLARKHGGTLADAIARGAQMKRDLADIGSFEEGLVSRRQGLSTAEARAQKAAETLSAARRAAAAGLEKRVNQVLGDLALGAARLPIAIEPREVGPQGGDRVRFLFSANPGEPPRPLAKIASGGELSRVMLAMKQALAKSDQVATYVFDEVDAGVGGATAETIGRKLKTISLDRQVIAITHLPQIAVFADVHLRVTKTVQDDRTTVTIDRLDGRQRSAEIARMLSGATPTKQATAHADDMLRRARV